MFKLHLERRLLSWTSWSYLQKWLESLKIGSVDGLTTDHLEERGAETDFGSQSPMKGQDRSIISQIILNLFPR